MLLLKLLKILNINNSTEFGLCSKTPTLKRSTTISNKSLNGRHYEFLLMMEKQWTQTDLDTDENTSHDGYCEVFFFSGNSLGVIQNSSKASLSDNAYSIVNLLRIVFVFVCFYFADLFNHSDSFALH